MRPTPMYNPPKGEGCETSVEHGLPLRAELDGGYCSRRPSPSPTWGSRFVGARELGPWVGEPKPQGKTPLRGDPSPDMTYLRTYLPTEVRSIWCGHSPFSLQLNRQRQQVDPHSVEVRTGLLYPTRRHAQPKCNFALSVPLQRSMGGNN